MNTLSLRRIVCESTIREVYTSRRISIGGPYGWCGSQATWPETAHQCLGFAFVAPYFAASSFSISSMIASMRLISAWYGCDVAMSTPAFLSS